MFQSARSALRWSKRLVGLSIRNRLEPADSLVDSFVSQYEQDRLLFVPWERLVSKEQEASTGAKREPVFSLDSSGKLRSETAKSTSPFVCAFCLRTVSWNSHDRRLKTNCSCRRESFGVRKFRMVAEL